MLEGSKIGLIGAGVMAEVIAAGLVRSKLVQPDDVVVSHYRQDRLDEFARLVPVRTTLSNRAVYEESDVTIICVRPQPDIMRSVLGEIRAVLDPNRLLTTIAAGVPTSFYERELGEIVPFVRAMPTFFGRIKAGTTGLSINSATTAEHLAVASRLFGTI